jgi:glutathione S-transferase
MIELYHNAMSVCSQKVRFCLEEKGIDWTDRHMNLRAGDQQTPEYLALNPKGVVPTLVHDGVTIVESTVINEYVDDIAPEPPLRPEDPAGAARMRLWTKQLDEWIHADTGVISNALAFRFQKLALGEDSLRRLIENMPDPAKRQRYQSVVYEGTTSPLFLDAIHRFAKLMADLESALTDRPWLAGDAVSLADLGYAPYLTRMEHLRLHRMWDDKPAIADWFARIRSRPAYQSSHAAWFDDKYLSLMAEKGEESWPGVRAALAA